MSEQPTPAPESEPEEAPDPDFQEALQEESDILTRQVEAMKMQHFEQRILQVNVQNRKLTRQAVDQAKRISELEQEVEELKMQVTVSKKMPAKKASARSNGSGSSE